MSVGAQFEAGVDGAAGASSGAGDTIERRRLDHFYQHGVGRLIRILAPPGYGKTSLAARWVAEDERIVCWIDLTRSHDDPVALFAAMRAALAGVVDVDRPTVAQAGAPNPYVRALEDGFGAVVRPVPFVLVLDDVHRLQNDVGQWLIRTVVDRMPRGSTVVLVGRGHHDQGTLARLRLAPGVVDVTAHDLAFERSESYRLLESMGVDATDADVADLVADLEGWPAGVRLAGQVLRAGTDRSHIARDVSLVDYLRSEWIGQLPADELGFLMEIACLQRFTGAKCDEVLGRSNSAALLQRLHRDRVLVFALDRRDDEYRMHGLLNRWLSSELKNVDPSRWTEIHLNAAAHWERVGDVDRAVEHAVAADDLDLIERLSVRHGGQYFTRGLDETVTRWLAVFPSERVRRTPGLCGLQAVKALHAGDDALAVRWMHLLDEANRGVDADDVPTTRWADVLHATLDERPAHELLSLLAPVRDQLRGGPWDSFGCWVHGGLSFLVGDTDEARASLATAAFEAELAGSPLLVGHANATSAIMAHCHDDTDAAEEHDRRARDAVGSCGGELLPVAALAMASAALGAARRGDDEAAMQRFMVAQQGLSCFRSVGPWYNVIARIALVRTALLLDDRESARTVMRELEHHAAVDGGLSSPAPGSALACAAELKSRVEAMHRPATGASALTDAERRVLHLLPTNLSLGDIADELFISRNTVKSHVASTYRKLGATKRSEAVEFARTAGLIPGAP